MSIRKARRDFERLKESVAPKQPLSQQTFFVRFDDETEAEALALYDLAEWPEGAIVVECLAGDRMIL
jgi:hypothetical protein